MFGHIFASPADAQARLKVCEVCPQRAMGFCTRCACLIAAKVRFSATMCPDDKWGVVEGVDRAYDGVDPSPK